MSDAPIKLPTLAAAEVDVETRSDGGYVLRSPIELGDYANSMGEHLVRWAGEAPARTLFADRVETSDDWTRISYADALAAARAIGQALLDRGLSAERPLMIISDNSWQNALLQLGAMHVGVPAVPVSPAYSLMSQDFGKLKFIAGLVTPGLVFAEDGAAFSNAIAATDFGDAEIVVARNQDALPGATAFDALRNVDPTSAVDDAFAKVGPETIAKILFTSGSTGMPKGVVNTQRMMCSNQKALALVWPFITERPPVTLDWLPWNHTFGGNHNFNLIIANGGTMYIDRGKPAPGLVEKTVANMAEVSPTIWWNVPRGFDMLVPHLEADPELRDRFFAEIDMIEYAGAALPQSTWDALENLSVAARGERVWLTSGWGSTETAPMATCLYAASDLAGVIGLPAPGTDIKLAPNGDKLEIRIKGPNIMPGYWRRDDLTAEAFDDENYYMIGDAGRFADPDDPSQGLVFDGRVTEDFKLTSGTWVHVGVLRIAVITAAAQVIQDAVVTGHGRDDIGLLIFPSLAGCRALAGDAEAGLESLVENAAVRAALADALAAHNAAATGSSSRIKYALLMTVPPRIDANEITDKGYINQRAVLSERAALVEALYANDPRVIRIG